MQELADRFASGLDDQVPSIDGDDEVDVGVGVWAGVVVPLDEDDDVELGANTFDDVRSYPVQAPVSAALRMMATSE